MTQNNWSKKVIITRLKELKDKGEQLNPSQLRKNDNKLLAAIGRYFGSWEEAIKEAGLDPKEERLRAPRKTRQELKLELIQFLQDLNARGKSINCSAIPDVKYVQIQRVFGSWEKAVKAAQLDPEKERKRPPSSGQGAVLEEIHKVVQEGQKRSKKLYDSARWYFGSWEQAIKAAGLEPRKKAQKKVYRSKLAPTKELELELAIKANLPHLTWAARELRERQGIYPTNQQVAEHFDVSVKEVELWQMYSQELMLKYLDFVKAVAVNCYFSNMNWIGFALDDCDEYVTKGNLILVEQFEQHNWGNGGDFPAELRYAIRAELISWSQRKMIQRAFSTISLETELSGNGGKTLTLADRVANTNSPDPYLAVTQSSPKDTELGVLIAIRKLPNSFQEVLLWDAGLRHKGKNKTEMSRMLDMSQGQLDSLRNSAKRRLSYLLTKK